jgi:HTH-type transcriptional regulator, transcriptional repressor of NAD biosynthesis genes
MKKIVVFGSESVGKTTLAAEVAKYFGVPCCPEYVRHYLQYRNQNLARKGIISLYEDIEPMAVGQLALEQSAMLVAENMGKKLLILDTNIEANYIYSRYYFNRLPALLEVWANKPNNYDYYVLLRPNVAWVADNLRDRPENREAMHLLFKNYLEERGKPFVEIEALHEQRTQEAIKHIEHFFWISATSNCKL